MQIVQGEVHRIENVINGTDGDSSKSGSSDDSLNVIAIPLGKMGYPRLWLDEEMPTADGEMTPVDAGGCANASRVVLPPADEAGIAETHPDQAMSDVDTVMSEKTSDISVDDAEMPIISVQGTVDRPLLVISRPGGRVTAARTVGGRRLKMARGITVDSGAADPVMPRRMVRGRGNKIRPSDASRAGVHYVSASANRIKNEGETDLKFDTDDGHSLNWTFQIAEVNKVLASVSYLVDHNHRVVFDKDAATGRDISFITNKATGASIKMRRDRNVWVIDAYINEDDDSSFTRPEPIP
jgi:hypothetical protein